jgi:Carbohydrate family 9 binding domain-like
MKRVVVGFPLVVMLAAGSVAQAKQVSIDFTGDTLVSQGLTQVNSSAGADGVTTFVKKGGKNVAATGGTDAARYLYLTIDPTFKQNFKSVWVAVEYFDEGKGGFKLQYDGPDGTESTSDPAERTKFDSQAFQRQVWHLVEPNLKGGLTGGADLRIDDRGEDAADGPEFIARVTVSDEDPDFTHLPNAVNKINIDGKIDAGEWDGAFSVTLDQPRFDAIMGSPLWKGPEDFSAIFSFKWDESAFYVLAQVRDATPRLNNDNPDGLKYWKGDGIELMLGLDDADPERTSLQEGTDFKLEVGVGDKPGWAVRDSDGKTNLDPIGSNFAITDTTGGYLYELQVPWAKLNNAKAQPGQRIAWHIVANNSTVSPSDQQMSLGPAGRADPWGHPNEWTRAELTPKPAQ